MLSVYNLPIEIQFIIMKYISYSPTAKLIREQKIIFDRKRELYDYINLYGIFHTNVKYRMERIFNPRIVNYLRSMQLSRYPLRPMPNKKEYLTERLIYINLHNNSQ